MSESLLTVAPIRSDAERAVLEGLIVLYQSKFDVERRPGLEPEQCHWQKDGHIDGYVSAFVSLPRYLLTFLCEQGPSTRNIYGSVIDFLAREWAFIYPIRNVIPLSLDCGFTNFSFAMSCRSGLKSACSDNDRNCCKTIVV